MSSAVTVVPSNDDVVKERLHRRIVLRMNRLAYDGTDFDSVLSIEPLLGGVFQFVLYPITNVLSFFCQLFVNDAQALRRSE